MTDWAAALRGKRLRATAPRLATLAVLEEAPHLGIAEIQERVRQRLGTASTQAVYDVLAALHGSRLIRRVEPAGQPPRFEVNTGDNHHHLICRNCGDLRNIACQSLRTTCAESDDTEGFDVDEIEVIFWGTCTCCAQARISR